MALLGSDPVAAASTLPLLEDLRETGPPPLSATNPVYSPTLQTTVGGVPTAQAVPPGPSHDDGQWQLGEGSGFFRTAGTPDWSWFGPEGGPQAVRDAQRAAQTPPSRFAGSGQPFLDWQSSEALRRLFGQPQGYTPTAPGGAMYPGYAPDNMASPWGAPSTRPDLLASLWRNPQSPDGLSAPQWSPVWDPSANMGPAPAGLTAVSPWTQPSGQAGTTPGAMPDWWSGFLANYGLPSGTPAPPPTGTTTPPTGQVPQSTTFPRPALPGGTPTPAVPPTTAALPNEPPTGAPDWLRALAGGGWANTLVTPGSRYDAATGQWVPTATDGTQYLPNVDGTAAAQRNLLLFQQLFRPTKGALTPEGISAVASGQTMAISPVRGPTANAASDYDFAGIRPEWYRQVAVNRVGASTVLTPEQKALYARTLESVGYTNPFAWRPPKTATAFQTDAAHSGGTWFAMSQDTEGGGVNTGQDGPRNPEAPTNKNMAAGVSLARVTTANLREWQVDAFHFADGSAAPPEVVAARLASGWYDPTSGSPIVNQDTGRPIGFDLSKEWTWYGDHAGLWVWKDAARTQGFFASEHFTWITPFAGLMSPLEMSGGQPVSMSQYLTNAGNKRVEDANTLGNFADNFVDHLFTPEGLLQAGLMAASAIFFPPASAWGWTAFAAGAANTAAGMGGADLGNIGTGLALTSLGAGLTSAGLGADSALDWARFGLQAGSGLDRYLVDLGALGDALPLGSAAIGGVNMANNPNTDWWDWFRYGIATSTTMFDEEFGELGDILQLGTQVANPVMQRQ